MPGGANGGSRAGPSEYNLSVGLTPASSPGRGAFGKEVSLQRNGELAGLSATPEPPLLGEVALRSNDGEVVQSRALPRRCVGSPFGGAAERSEAERVSLAKSEPQALRWDRSIKEMCPSLCGSFLSASSPSQSKPFGFASSPKGRAIGRPGKLCCSLGPNKAQSAGPCPHWQQLLNETAEPGCSRIVRALLGQQGHHRHASGSPFGGAGERSETERVSPAKSEPQALRWDRSIKEMCPSLSVVTRAASSPSQSKPFGFASSPKGRANCGSRPAAAESRRCVAGEGEPGSGLAGEATPAKIRAKARKDFSK